MASNSTGEDAGPGGLTPGSRPSVIVARSRPRGGRTTLRDAEAAALPGSTDAHVPQVVILTIAFGLVLPLVLVGTQTGLLDGLPELLRWIIVLYTAFRLSHLISQGVPRWLGFAFWMFSYVWMGMAGLAQTLRDANPYQLQLTNGEEIVSCLVVLLGLVVFDVVYTLTGRLRDHPGRQREISQPRVMVLLGMTAFVVPGLVMVQGGFSSFLVTRFERNDILAEQGITSSGSTALGVVLTFVTLVVPFATFVLLFGLMRLRPERWRQPAWWGALVFSGAFALFLGNPIVSARFWFGTILFGLCFIIAGNRGSGAVRTVMAGLLVMTVFVFPYADHFRTPDASLQTRSAAEFFTDKPDYDAVTQTAVMQRYVAENGHTWGKQALSVVGFWVPRSIWPDKAEPTGTLLARTAAVGLENLSAPLWTEGYMDFGVPGTVLMLALFGFVCRRGDSAYVRGSSEWIRVIVPALAGYSYVVYRGSLLGIAPGGFVLLLCCLLSAKRIRDARAASAVDGGQGQAVRLHVAGDEGGGTDGAPVPQRHAP